MSVLQADAAALLVTKRPESWDKDDFTVVVVLILFSGYFLDEISGVIRDIFGVWRWWLLLANEVMSL